MPYTPTPWECVPTAGHETHGQWAIYGQDGRTIAIIYEGADNARDIVRAVNSHAALLASCEDAWSALDRLPYTAWAGYTQTILQLSNAIAQAKGD